jgi:hypothetical protein
MNNLSINSLFPNSHQNRGNNTNNILDVHSLFNYNNNNNNNSKLLSSESNLKHNTNFNFNLNKLLNKKSDRRKEIIKIYKMNFKTTLIKINDADDMNLTSIICTIPPVVLNYKEYSSIENIHYIQEKIRSPDYCMDSLIMSDNSIFICWENIEDNKKNLSSSKN